MVYQCIDLCALALIIHLLRSVLVTMRGTYDDIRLAPFVVVTLILGAPVVTVAVILGARAVAVALTLGLCALALLIHLLYGILVAMNSTYQDHDDIRVAPIIALALLFGALLHGDMNESPLFDSLWLAGLFVSAATPLPHYCVISKACGQMQVLTAHYITATAVEGILSGAFMWYVRDHITCIPWIGSFGHTKWAILLAHLIHMVLLSDVAFYYVHALLAQGSQAPILPLGAPGTDAAFGRTLLATRRYRSDGSKNADKFI